MDTSSVPADQRIPADALHDVKKLRGVLARIFDDSGGPVELPVLVETLVVAAGFAPQPFVSASTLRQQAVVDSTPTSLESREYLAQLWTEIEQLPVRQRRALLLQLSLDDGESVAPVLTAIGIASVRQLAGALEWPVADLLALWNELPLPDQRIAAMLSITRQQVINLRKSARERLARRMRRPRGAARNGA